MGLILKLNRFEDRDIIKEIDLFKELLSSVENFELWSIISMNIFIIVFIGIVVYTFKLKKFYVDYMAQLPLSENENINLKES